MASAPPLRNRSRSRSRWPLASAGCDDFAPISAFNTVRRSAPRASFSDVVRGLVQAFGGEGEDFHPIFGYADRMLELRRQRTVAGHRGPAVIQHFHAIGAQIDHRLDGEEHAGP